MYMELNRHLRGPESLPTKHMHASFSKIPQKDGPVLWDPSFTYHILAY